MTTNTTTEQGDLAPLSQRCSGAIFIENKEQIEERERERETKEGGSRLGILFTCRGACGSCG